MRVIGDKNQISEDVFDFMISYLPFFQKSIRSELAKLFSVIVSPNSTYTYRSLYLLFTRYKHKNFVSKGTYKRYSDDLPLFLHNRPKAFIKHCMKRLKKVCFDVIQETGSCLIVNGHRVRLDVPSYPCKDFSQHGWPCKHMLTLLT